jgi:uncharacterized membrane protein
MSWHAEHKKNLSVGQMAADIIRDKMGSWGFVISSLVYLCVWMWTSGLGTDPFPWILLNLILSCLAALQGAILLIAAKRQDEISAALAQHDYDTNTAAKAEIEELLERLIRIENDKLDRIIAHMGLE